MKNKRKLLILAVAIFIVAIIIFLFVKKSGSDITKVTTVKANLKSVVDTYTETGCLGAGNMEQVMSEVSGKVISVNVNLNQRVNKGDIIFRIDDSDLNYQIDQAQSALSGYEAQIEKSRTGRVLTVAPTEYLDGLKEQMEGAKSAFDAASDNYHAAEKLYNSGTLAKLELDGKKAAMDAAESAYNRAKTSYDKSKNSLDSLRGSGTDEKNIDNKFFDAEEKALKAQIKAKQSGISQLNNQKSKCIVTAKSAGIITDLPVKNLSVIQAGQVAAVIKDEIDTTGNYEAEADVLTSIAPYLKIGDPVEVNLILRGSDEKYMGRISEIYNYAIQGTSALGLDEYKVHVKVKMDDNSNLKDRVGYGVNMKFQVFKSDKCLVIPSSAVFKKDDNYFVYTIKNGKAEKKPIDVEYKSASEIVIKSGISKGKEVINNVDSEGIYNGASVKKVKK